MQGKDKRIAYVFCRLHLVRHAWFKHFPRTGDKFVFHTYGVHFDLARVFSARFSAGKIGWSAYDIDIPLPSAMGFCFESSLESFSVNHMFFHWHMWNNNQRQAMPRERFFQSSQ